MVYKVFNKKSAGSGVANNEILKKSTISGKITQTNYEKLWKKNSLFRI